MSKKTWWWLLEKREPNSDANFFCGNKITSRPSKTYIHQFGSNTGCRREDLHRTMTIGMDGETQRNLCYQHDLMTLIIHTHTHTHTHIYIYIYIYIYIFDICVCACAYARVRARCVCVCVCVCERARLCVIELLKRRTLIKSRGFIFQILNMRGKRICWDEEHSRWIWLCIKAVEWIDPVYKGRKKT